MRGTRRTIVTAAASFVVVLGVGGVAAATGSHSAIDDSVKHTSTSLSPVTNHGGQQPQGRALGVRKQQAVTSTTVADDDTTSTTIAEDDTTSTTIADDTTSTTVPDTTPTTKLEDDDHKVCDDHGQDNEGAEDEADHQGRHHGGDDSGHDDQAKTTRADSSGHDGSRGGSDKHGRG